MLHSVTEAHASEKQCKLTTSTLQHAELTRTKVEETIPQTKLREHIPRLSIEMESQLRQQFKVPAKIDSSSWELSCLNQSVPPCLV